mmetsp:Transcript_15065/g.21456  ORF Transcript_15065/g.21456 Transcript_15065/m.21456 type:complete len:698 (+) Transcript_15065:105-2198(+)
MMCESFPSRLVALVAVTWTILGSKFAVAGAALRGHHSGIQEENPRLLSLSNSPLSTGGHVLDGYNTCDQFQEDVMQIFKAAGNAAIQSQKNSVCDQYSNENGSISGGKDNYNDASSANNRRLAMNTASYEGNNRIPGVNEMNLIASDGTYIFIGQGQNILVSDFDGILLANISTVPSISSSWNASTWIPITSLFVHDNILTVLSEGPTCDETDNCKRTTRAYIYQLNFKDTESPVTLLKQLDVFSSNPNAYPYTDARNIGNVTLVFISYDPRPWLWQLDRCLNDYKTLSAMEYEKAALEYLDTNVNSFAREVVNTISLGIDGTAQSCKNIIRISKEMILAASKKKSMINFLRITSFGYDTTSNSVQSDIYAIPFLASYDDPILYVTKDSTLIALPSPNGDGTTLIQYVMDGTRLIPKAIGTVEGGISSSFHIDSYNGFYRIVTSLGLVYVLEEVGSELRLVGTAEQLGQGNLVDLVGFLSDKNFLSNTKSNAGGDMSLMPRSSTLSFKPYDLSSSSFMSLMGIDDISSGKNLFVQSIENEEFVLAVSLSETNGMTVGLFQITDNGLSPVGNLANSNTVFPTTTTTSSESYWSISSEIMSNPHAFSYFPLSHKVVIPVHAYRNDNEKERFDGFLVYNVDRKKGIKYNSNVSHTMGWCLPSQSMDVDGDLITFMGDTVKRTFNTNSFGNEKLELTLRCY